MTIKKLTESNIDKMLTHAEQNKQATDSSTRVYQRLHGVRTTMTIRIKPEIKEAFTRRTRDLGLSTCHVAEGLFDGWLMGVGEQVERVHQSPTINMTLVRDVKRIRRYKEEYEEISESVGVVCGFCHKIKPRIFMVRYASRKKIPSCEDCYKEKCEKGLVREVLGEVHSGSE